MKRIIITLFLFFIAISFLSARETSDKNTYTPLNNRIGISASMISGWGFSYQHNFDPLAVKFTAFYYYFKSSDPYNYYYDTTDSLNPYSSDALGSLGLELKYYLFKSKYVNLYPFVGFSYWVNHNEDPDYIYGSKPPYEQTVIHRIDNTDTFNGGAGFGIELLAGKHFAFNFDVGLKYLNGQIKRDTYDNPPKTENLEDIYFGIAVGGGISFAF